MGQPNRAKTGKLKREDVECGSDERERRGRSFGVAATATQDEASAASGRLLLRCGKCSWPSTASEARPFHPHSIRPMQASPGNRDWRSLGLTFAGASGGQNGSDTTLPPVRIVKWESRLSPTSKKKCRPRRNSCCSLGPWFSCFCWRKVPCLFPLFRPLPRTYVGEYNNRRRGFLVSDPLLGWKMRPHLKFDVFQINAEGFRAPFDFHENQACKGITFAGDSFTFGAGVRYERTFALTGSGWRSRRLRL